MQALERWPTVWLAVCLLDDLLSVAVKNYCEADGRGRVHRMEA